MVPIKNLVTQMSVKFYNVLSSRKGKVYFGIGGCVVAAVVVSAIAVNNIGSSATAANNRFKIDAVVSSSLGISSNNSGPTVSSSSTNDTVSIPVVSAAPAPSGAAPNAAAALSTIPVTSIDFNHASLTLQPSETVQLTANITPTTATDKTLAWTSTNSAVATVDSSGNVKAVSTGTTYIRATNPDGQRDTCVVTVTAVSTGPTQLPKAANNTTVGSPNSSLAPGSTTNIPGHVANYQGVNETRTFTDEITGIQQTVQFLGVGAGYCEVAAGNAEMNTTAALGSAHSGLATATIIGTNGINQSSGTAVTKDGSDGGSFTFANLTASTYTIQLTAHDGTVVARYHFSVNSGGNVQ